MYKKSCEAQIVHFGQIPTQLFDKKHVKRNQKKLFLLELKVIEKYMLMNKILEKPMGVHLDEGKKMLTIVKRHNIEHYSLQKNPLSLLKTSKISI